MNSVAKRILYIVLISLIVICVVTSITTGSYLMIKELEDYECGHVNVGIIIYLSSILIFLISLIFRHKLFVCCFDSIYVGLIGLIISIFANAYIIFMIGYENSKCLDYYSNNKEGEYYVILVSTNVLLLILLSLYLYCI